MGAAENLGPFLATELNKRFINDEAVYETSVAPPRDASADVIKDYVRALHAEDDAGLINTQKMDTVLFGKRVTELESELFLPVVDPWARRQHLVERYPKEQPWDGKSEVIWTPYHIIKAVVKGLNLTEADTLYDLGSGYGRVVLYAGITTPAKCRGVEMVTERVEVAQRAKRKLELDNAEFTEGNVLNVDYSDGNVFYAYAPFSQGTFHQVIMRLGEIADEREAAGKGPITVAARASTRLFEGSRLFRHVETIETPLGPFSSGTASAKIFESLPRSERT